MSELDAAIFDFGGVLTTPIRWSFAALEQQMDIPEGSLLRAFIGHDDASEPDYYLLEKGLISEAEFYVRMRARIREATGADLPSEEPDAIRQHLFGGLRRNDEMILAAATIGQHYKTAILSNNVKEWTDWRAMVDAHIFDIVVDSSEVGLRKPDPEIYVLTCERLGVEPARAAFVDDIPVNVEAASALGMRAIQFTQTQDVLDALRPHFPRAFAPHTEEAHA